MVSNKMVLEIFAVMVLLFGSVRSDMRLPSRSWGALETKSDILRQSSGGAASAKYDELAQLTDTLDKLGKLGEYFNHRGRPR